MNNTNKKTYDQHDHMVDALRYAMLSMNYPKPPWYRVMYFRTRRFIRSCWKAVVAFFKEVFK